VYLLVDPGFYPPLNFYEASRFVPPPLRWTTLTDTTDKETNERTDGRTSIISSIIRSPTVSPSVRLLDGVWHLRIRTTMY